MPEIDWSKVPVPKRREMPATVRHAVRNFKPTAREPWKSEDALAALGAFAAQKKPGAP